MKKPSQTQIILKVLESATDWIVSHQLEKVNTPYGWLGTAALRRCRDLEGMGLIEKRDDGKYVWYRIKNRPPQVLPKYRVENINQLTLIK